MANTIVKTIEKPHLSIKVQTLAAIFAIVGAVVVPQIFHVLGAVSDYSGRSVGRTLCRGSSRTARTSSKFCTFRYAQDNHVAIYDA